MEYAINHVHIRSSDPHASASWYVKHFGAKIISDREVMPGTITVSMQVGGTGPAQHLLPARRVFGRKGCRRVEPAGPRAFRVRRGGPRGGVGQAGEIRRPHRPAPHGSGRRCPSGLYRRSGRRANRVGAARMSCHQLAAWTTVHRCFRSRFADLRRVA